MRPARVASGSLRERPSVGSTVVGAVGGTVSEGEFVGEGDERCTG